MYSKPIEVINMIVPDMRSHLIGEEYIESEAEQIEKLTPLVTEAIENADAEIDGYLVKRYPIPLSRVPANIEKYSKDIALYNMYSRIGIDEGSREVIYAKRYNSAISYLTAVAKGVVDLDIETMTKKASSGFRMQSSTRLFSRNSLKGM
jgi:phage gp36-like protein